MWGGGGTAGAEEKPRARRRLSQPHLCCSLEPSLLHPTPPMLARCCYQVALECETRTVCCTEHKRRLSEPIHASSERGTAQSKHGRGGEGIHSLCPCSKNREFDLCQNPTGQFTTDSVAAIEPEVVGRVFVPESIAAASDSTNDTTGARAT